MPTRYRFFSFIILAAVLSAFGIQNATAQTTSNPPAAASQPLAAPTAPTAPTITNSHNALGGSASIAPNASTKRTELRVYNLHHDGDIPPKEDIELSFDDEHIDSLIHQAISEDPGGSVLRRIVIKRHDDDEPSIAAPQADAKDEADVVVIEKSHGVSDKDQDFSVESHSAKGKGCHLQFHSDSSANGTTYTVHIDGLQDAMEQMHETMKGMDKKMEKLNKMLKSLNIKIGGLDSSLQLTISGVERENGSAADMKLFIPKALESLEDLKLDDLNLETQLDERDDEHQQVQTHVYVLKFRDGEVEHNTTLRTERDENQDLKLEELSLSPNPSNDGHFRLSVQSGVQSPIELHVSSENGKEIYTENVSNFNGAYEKSFDLSSYGSGVYFIRVLQQGKAATLKVIIEK